MILSKMTKSFSKIKQSSGYQITIQSLKNSPELSKHIIKNCETEEQDKKQMRPKIAH